MVLEAFAVVSLAANIAQFVDFSSKLITESRNVHRSTSGISDTTAELQDVTKKFKRLSEGLTIRHEARSDADKAIAELANLCRDEADEFIDLLDSLRVSGRHRKLESIYQSLRALWKKDKIEEMQKKLAFFQTQLTLHLVQVIR